MWELRTSQKRESVKFSRPQFDSRLYQEEMTSTAIKVKRKRGTSNGATGGKKGGTLKREKEKGTNHFTYHGKSLVTHLDKNGCVNIERELESQALIPQKTEGYGSFGKKGQERFLGSGTYKGVL